MKDPIKQASLSPAKRALLERRIQGDSRGLSVALTPMLDDTEHRYDPFPLTDMVEAQWMGRNRSYDLGNQAAHVYAEFFDGEVALDRFTRAWQRLIDRHEMLRAFVRTDGQYQIIKEVPPYEIKVTDIRLWATAEKEEYLRSQRRRMARQVSPSDRWPLFEIVATRLEEHCYRIHLSCDLLISDIKSFQIMGKELAILYQDPEAVLQPERLEVSYRDYVVAIHEMKQSDDYQRSRDYWINQRLPMLPPAPSLPMLKTPSKVGIPYFNHRMGTVARSKWRCFKSTAVALGLTPDSAVASVFADVIGQWNKSPQFSLNVLSFQRLPLHLQINEIVGNFGSTLLLGVDQHTGATFIDRARTLHAQLLRDMDHWRFSGVGLLREINRQRGGSTGATMPVVFASTLNFSSGKQPSLHGERNTSFYEQHMKYIQLQTPQVWFDHQVSEDDGHLVLEWDVVEDLFPAGLIDAMWGAYLRMFDRLSEGEGTWTETDRSYLLPAEDRALYEQVNATEATLPPGMLHDAAAVQAQQQPTRPAVLGSHVALSFAELDQRANRLAHYLLTSGAGPGQRVAIIMDPGPEQLLGCLGVLKAGAAYVPIDPHLPPERLQFLLDNGQVCHILTQSSLRERLTLFASYRVFSVDDSSLSSGLSSAPAPGTAPTDLAYIIYTSGSTGQPKGVMVDHRAALNTVLDINQRFDVGPNDRVLALSNINFDLSVYDLFGSLAAGATLVTTTPEGHRDPAHWDLLLREQKVTIWNSVPALLEMYLGYLEAHQLQLPDSLRLVLLSGDWIPLSQPELLRRLGGHRCKIVSLGGATEAAIWSIYYPIGQVEPHWRSIPYGKPLANQRFYVLNERMESCPRWVPGQLYIGGLGLAQGYWQDPDKTAHSFLRHPRTGERLYRTGDLGRYLPDGNIEFLGRQDTQVKVLGHRIELGEIEATLLQHPAVQAAVVAALGDNSQDRHLVAFVVLHAQDTDPEALGTYLRGRLPSYMVPGKFTLLDALPQTPNGKVDRKALISLAIRPHESRDFVAPRSPMEQQLAQIWAKVLNRDSVGVQDNFFDLGGNSLLVTHVAARVYEGLGMDVPLRVLYDAPSIAELAQALTAMNAPGGSESVETDLAAEAVLALEIHA